MTNIEGGLTRGGIEHLSRIWSNVTGLQAKLTARSDRALSTKQLRRARELQLQSRAFGRVAEILDLRFAE